MIATLPPKPVMFVSRDLDHKWIGNYMKKKHLALSQLIGKPETTSLYFSLDNFSDLIDRISEVKGVGGVKVYFASYCLTGMGEVDAIANSGWMDLLTLVFSATDNRANDLGQYYMIKPAGGVLPLSADTARTLVRRFQNQKIPFLTTIIKDAGLPNFQETKSFYYPLSNFNGPFDIIKELKLHHAAGITAFIGSYGEGDKSPTGSLDVSWQLNVIFELAKTISQGEATYYYHFDLENTSGWSDRPDPALQGGDTSNPCPPAVCGTGL
jgi:hypothetical protein